MKQVESLGEGLTHLIINGRSTDYMSTEEIKEYLEYLDRFTFKLKEILAERGVELYR